jgi:hypothetical protein
MNIDSSNSKGIGTLHVSGGKNGVCNCTDHGPPKKAIHLELCPRCYMTICFGYYPK